MITLIGSRCKASNRLSRGVLIPRFLLGNLKIAHVRKCMNYFILLYGMNLLATFVVYPERNAKALSRGVVYQRL